MPLWWSRYWERHQHPLCKALHIVGVPLLVVALGLAAVQLAQGRWDLWWRPASLLTISYFMQWLGHRVEGNDMGEVILIKRWLGKPYIAVAGQSGKTTGRTGHGAEGAHG